MSTDRRLNALEKIRIANGYTKAYIAEKLGAPLPQYYTNWLRRNGLPKSYYDTADAFIDAHKESENTYKVEEPKPVYAQPKAGLLTVRGYAPTVQITNDDADYHAAKVLAERLPKHMKLQLAKTLLNKLTEDEETE